MKKKHVFVTFIDKKTEDKFESLEDKKNSQELVNWINTFIENIKENPLKGIKIPKKLWPKKYVQEYNITNLYKINLPQVNRLLYTIQSDEEMTLIIIFDWHSHKEYERVFKY